MFNYAIIDASGNIVLLIDVGSSHASAYRNHVRDAVILCEGGSRIDIIGFISRIDGRLVASFWNPDGTPEKMCGNACRSIPLALQTWLGSERIPQTISVSTEFCCAKATLHADGTSSVEFPIDAISICTFMQTHDVLIDVGTPHVVRKVDELFSDEVSGDGHQLSTSAAPVNATFCKVLRNEILLRTFERGVGETKSCGTGAIAATIALDRRKAIEHLSNPRTIRFVSGRVLNVARSADKTAIAVSGGCELMASGILSLKAAYELNCR